MNLLKQLKSVSEVERKALSKFEEIIPQLNENERLNLLSFMQGMTTRNQQAESKIAEMKREVEYLQEKLNKTGA